MKSRWILGFIGMMLCGFWAGSASACWVEMPLDNVVSNSPVVVVGEIVEIKSAEPKEGERVFDTASIKVTKVLKNTLPKHPVKAGEKIPLSMPSTKNTMIISTDISYPAGTKGIWILDLKDQTFWATYPGDLQPVDKEKEIKAIIKKQQ